LGGFACDEDGGERRHDAWCRLMALFRAAHGGVYHPNFKLPAYGGDLLDPDAFPFLEGRFEGHDEPIAVDNRTVFIGDKLRLKSSRSWDLRGRNKEKRITVANVNRKRSNNQLDIRFTDRFDNAQILIFRSRKIFNWITG